MTIERSFDYALVREIVTHPKIYRRSLLSDSAPAREEWRAVEGERFWYIVPRLEGRPLGVIGFDSFDPECWIAHIAMLPEAWGARATEACLRTINWLAEHSPCKRFEAYAPVYNPLVAHLTWRIGMTRTGTKRASIARGGQLYDQAIFEKEITR